MTSEKKSNLKLRGR